MTQSPSIVVAHAHSAPPHPPLLSLPRTACTSAAHSAHNWGLYVSLAWLPTFFSASYDMDLSQSAFYSVLPYVSGAIASAGAGSVHCWFSNLDLPTPVATLPLPLCLRGGVDVCTFLYAYCMAHLLGR